MAYRPMTSGEPPEGELSTDDPCILKSYAGARPRARSHASARTAHTALRIPRAPFAWRCYPLQMRVRRVLAAGITILSCLGAACGFGVDLDNLFGDSPPSDGGPPGD